MSNAPSSSPHAVGDLLRPGADAIPDPETGEYIEAVGTSEQPQPALGDSPTKGEPRTGIAGERTIPSVNRERSVRSRVSSALAIGTLLLLGGGFIAWYYVNQFSRADEAKAAAARVAENRAAGEMKLPPLGRVDPPSPGTNAVTSSAASASSAALPSGGFFGAAPPLPPTAAGPQPAYGAPPPGPAQKTPEQLALERRLGQPVLLRAQLGGVDASAMPPGMSNAVPIGNVGAPPNIAAILGSLQTGPGGAMDTSSPAGPTSLGTMLRSTPTPAVAAQVLPTRRFLLPKGAFLDCTLETAIDSTYDGMVTCIGATDVYSADGKVVLLERGSKYVGEKRGELRQGQGRVFVLWNEARTPTGVVVNLASPGTDELGRTGLPGFVDTHFWDRFGAAILISVIDSGLQALANTQQRGGNSGSVVLNPQGSHDVLTEVLKSTVAIPPTVVKNQGERIQVLVARDVDFRSVYALRSTGDAR